MELKPVLIDTNILIPALAGQEPYASFVSQLIKTKRLALSVIVIAEFLTGAEEEEERIFNALVSQSNILVVDLAVCQLGAWYRKQFLQKGKKIALPDCFIAATCKIYDTTLATLNRKDYPMADIEIQDKFNKPI